jgi:hypothetical protein
MELTKEVVREIAQQIYDEADLVPDNDASKLGYKVLNEYEDRLLKWIDIKVNEVKDE